MSLRVSVVLSFLILPLRVAAQAGPVGSDAGANESAREPIALAALAAQGGDGMQASAACEPGRSPRTDAPADAQASAAQFGASAGATMADAAPGATSPMASSAPTDAPLMAAVAPADSAEVVEPNMTPFWISVGATLVLGGTAATFGGLAAHASSQLDEALQRFPARSQEVAAERVDLKTFSKLRDGFIAGSILAGSSALYFLINPPPSAKPGEQPAVPRALYARLSPSPSGVTLYGRF